MDFYRNDAALIEALNSSDPAKTEAAIQYLFYEQLGSLSKSDPAQFKGVANELRNFVALPSSSISHKHYDPFAALDGNQQKIQLTASLHDLILLTSGAQQIALQNQQVESHSSARGASPRTPFGVMMDWARDGASEQQTQRREAMQKASWENVGTAHPTESKSAQKVQAYSQLMEPLARGKIDASMLAELRGNMRQFEVTSSDFVNIDNGNTMTVEQEVESQVAILKNIMQAVPAVVRENMRASRAIAARQDGTDPGQWINSQPIKSKTWVAGDRDGNVNVDVSTTRAAALRYAEAGREILIAELNRLPQDLEEITEIIRKLEDDHSGEYSAKELRRELGAVTEKLCDDAIQPARQEIENIQIILNHLDVDDKITAAQMHIRQDAAVMSDMISTMLGDDYAAMTDDAKSALLLELLEDPPQLEEAFDRMAQHFVNAYAAAPDNDGLKVRADMAKVFRLLPQHPSAWDLFIIANCGNGLEGSALGKARHVFENLLLLKIVGADHILNIAQLYESRQQLRDAGIVTEELLSHSVFTEFLAKHNNELVVQYALSDTTRQHGSGVRADQEEAPVLVNMAILRYNHDKPRGSWIHQKEFMGGGADFTRGGRDPATWSYSFVRKFRARAIAQLDADNNRIYSDEEIAGSVSLSVMQTRQGRDNARFYGNVTAARSHLSEMTACAMNLARFISTKPERVDDQKLIIEDAADQRAKKIFDRAISFYENYFANLIDQQGNEITPWRTVGKMNISSRANSRSKKKAQLLSGVRAITQKTGLQLAGGYDNAWLGVGAALNAFSLGDRREICKDSRLMREWVFNTLVCLDRTDLDSEYRLLGIERPKIIPHDDYQSLKSIPPHEMDNAGAEARLLWKDVQFRETCAVCAETLYGDPAAKCLSPAQALRPFGRLSMETDHIDHLTRLARHLMVNIYRQNDGSDPILNQMETHCGRAVFDGMATQHTAISPGFGDNEYRLHELLSKMFSDQPVKPRIMPRHGVSKNGNPMTPVWPVGKAL